MANGTPAHVPELVIASLQARERGVVISLPAPPNSSEFAADQCRASMGSMSAKPRTSAAVQMLGGPQRITLPAADVVVAV